MEEREVLLLVVIPVVISIVFGYMYFKSKSKMKIKSSQIDQSVDRVTETSTLYVPKEVGHRTTNRRIFSTNKGLRAYSVNTSNFPLPGPKTVPN